MTVDAFAPAIVGHVPMILGRYWADGLPPEGSMPDPELLELAPASVMSPELDPELPLDPDEPPEPPFDPELPLVAPLDPELPFDPELPRDPEELPEPPEPLLLVSPGPPSPAGSVVDDPPPQLMTSAKPVTVIPKPSVRRMASSVAASETPPAAARAIVKALLGPTFNPTCPLKFQSSMCNIRLRRSGIRSFEASMAPKERP
jgi:hypothetical protein